MPSAGAVLRITGAWQRQLDSGSVQRDVRSALVHLRPWLLYCYSLLQP
jgi:hypothetical protein